MGTSQSCLQQDGSSGLCFVRNLNFCLDPKNNHPCLCPGLDQQLIWVFPCYLETQSTEQITQVLKLCIAQPVQPVWMAGFLWRVYHTGISSSKELRTESSVTSQGRFPRKTVQGGKLGRQLWWVFGFWAACGAVERMEWWDGGALYAQSTETCESLTHLSRSLVTSAQLTG